LYYGISVWTGGGAARCVVEPPHRPPGLRGGGTHHCVKTRRDWKAVVVPVNSSLWKNAPLGEEPGALDRCVTLRLHANLRNARTAESLCNLAIPLLEEPTWRCLRVSLCKSAFRRGEQHADIRNNCPVRGLAPFLKPGAFLKNPLPLDTSRLGKRATRLIMF
jgi:hypothetical protein